MTSLHIKTPLIESRPLSVLTGKTIWLKMEALQPSGSFKLRGVGLACQEYVRRGAKRLVSSSGGNAGIAVAYAGRHLGVPSLVVVPHTTSERAKTLIRQEGAKVMVHGASWQDANACAQKLLEETDAFIHPFDDPLLWQGHASLVDEVARARVKLDAVILSVGGGGLYCGVVEGLRRNNLAQLPIIAVETNGADSLHRSIAARERIELPAITSLATSLGARRVCEQAFLYSQEHPTVSLTVSDRSAVLSCERFINDQRVLVEPACGAALAPVYEQRPELAEYKNILVVVCGGVTAPLEQILLWAEQYQKAE